MYFFIVNDTKQKHNQRSLTMAEISREETGVKLVCKFADEYPEASCILIYRKYNTTILTVNKYNGSTVFPLIITVNDSATYTFSVFGMNGRTEMQPEPVKTVLILPWSARGKQIYNGLYNYAQSTCMQSSTYNLINVDVVLF